ncbi:MAG: hypothetical protein ABG776_03440 [Cyanobacteria bacterium J06555_13]
MMNSVQDIAKKLSKRKGSSLVKLIKSIDPSQRQAVDRAMRQSMGLNLDRFEACYQKTMDVLGQRRYQPQKNYPDMNAWFKFIAEQYVKVFGSHYALMAQDEAFYATTNTIGAIVGAGAPPAIYHLSAPLGAALRETELPSNQLVTMKRALDCGVFALPHGLLINPDGDSLECIAVAHTKPTDETWLNFDERRQKRADYCGAHHKPVIFLMATTSQAVYGTNIVFGRDDQPKLDFYEVEDGMAVATGGNLRAVQDREAESQFIIRFRNLALQCLLLMQIRPELISNGKALHPSQSMKGRGFGTMRASSKSVLSPNWIGKHYEIKTERSSQQQGANAGKGRASPRTHWRKGHYTRVRYGPMTLEDRPYRMDWREPKLINP